jgi:hypothetical protein
LTLQQATEDLETKLEITARWTPECTVWKETEKKVMMHDFQLALDRLEGLVVARHFELTKLNHSGTGMSFYLCYRQWLIIGATGYKMRTHIAKALKARSQAIHTAVSNYNEVAAKLSPPRPSLDIQTVLDYVFLAQFDILRDSRHEIQERSWARAAEHEAANAYFKLSRSHEEIQRLNIEIQCLSTWMWDEEQFLEHEITRLQSDAPLLAHQLSKSLKMQEAVNVIHRQRIRQIESLDGFTGCSGMGRRKGSLDSVAVTKDMGNEGFQTIEVDEDDEMDGEEASSAVDATYEAFGIHTD